MVPMNSRTERHTMYVSLRLVYMRLYVIIWTLKDLISTQRGSEEANRYFVVSDGIRRDKQASISECGVK